MNYSTANKEVRFGHSCLIRTFCRSKERNSPFTLFFYHYIHKNHQIISFSELYNKIENEELDFYQKVYTSYDSLRNDIENYDVEFNYLVIDEAQYIKNIEALKTRKVKEIKADHKVALTGTPIENNLLDLWSIFDFIIFKITK